MSCHKVAISGTEKNDFFYDDNSGNYIYDDILSGDDNPKSSKKVAKYTCDICQYITRKKYNLDKHLSSVKHQNLVATLSKHPNYEFLCDSCDYYTSKKYNYEKHMVSLKHLKNTTAKSNTLYVSNSESESQTTSNMVYDLETHLEDFKKNVISTLMTQFTSVLEENKSILAEQTRMMIEQNKMIEDIANKPSNHVTNNNTNNQSFNLNMFLNETCKDAMNVSDFIEGLIVTVEDMELTSTMGFAKAMSHIIMKNLNAIDVCKRPIHCSDVKRETMYLKHNGVWEKDTDDKKKTKEIIYNLSFVNWKRLMEWRFLPRNKGYNLSDHYKNDEFNKLVMAVNTVDMNEINKVVTYLCRDVAIDKAKFRAGGYRKQNA